MSFVVAGCATETGPEPVQQQETTQAEVPAVEEGNVSTDVTLYYCDFGDCFGSLTSCNNYCHAIYGPGRSCTRARYTICP